MKMKSLMNDSESKDYLNARNIAFRYLALSDKTETQIRNKLIDNGFEENIIESVITYLKGKNYVNDFNFACNYVESKVNNNKYGNKVIKEKLIEKGVKKDIIQKAFEKMCFNEFDTAISLLNEKTRGNNNFSCKDKQKYFNYLMRKGFEYEICIEAIETYIKDRNKA